MVSNPNSPILIDGEPMLWVEPLRHEGVRNVTPKHLLNTNGSSVFKNREVQHESGTEKKAATVLKARRGVVEVRSQFMTVEYYDNDGVVHKHTLDYCVRYESGRWEAVAVKQETKRAEAQAILDGMLPEYRALFDKLTVMTELDVPWCVVRNAASILFYRELHHDYEHHVRVLLDELQQHRRARVCFYQMYTPGIDRPSRTTAIWRLIDLGHLKAEPGQLVNELTWFTVET
ncbi:hypothetical protein NOJ05_28125 [Neorhizobium galegae]|uniref:hypothetical protein n=1 Tax=Neorhizobium galegae TaxID=399 RepID=UPI0006216E02|nr:hypothetical protein [Neorhizobium galegae]MCQ1781091.1 hypothetical protein [Neorhizobium galegae]MCQ1797732.1 hypothetical protein [Neorhizobium galegae]CDZ27007.1 TnsA endonuclease [Neorhizobium galegae bv. officinalis]